MAIIYMISENESVSSKANRFKKKYLSAKHNHFIYATYAFLMLFITGIKLIKVIIQKSSKKPKKQQSLKSSRYFTLTHKYF